ALTTYPDTYLMGDVADSGTRRGARIHLEPGGVIEAFPLPGAMRRWVAHTGTARLGTGRFGKSRSARTPEELAAIVRRRTGERIDPATNTMISAFGVRRRTAERMVDGRVVLIGDAAHEVSPIGGQGMTLGWLDALALAPLLEGAAVPRPRCRPPRPREHGPGSSPARPAGRAARRRAAGRAGHAPAPRPGSCVLDGLGVGPAPAPVRRPVSLRCAPARCPPRRGRSRDGRALPLEGSAPRRAGAGGRPRGRPGGRGYETAGSCRRPVHPDSYLAITDDAHTPVPFRSAIPDRSSP